jgi:hypothetical protein
MPDTGARSLWNLRAERILEDALGRIEEDDVIPELSAAMACLRIDAGELSAHEMDSYWFPGEDVPSLPCTCSPELVARGGRSGDCRAIRHGTAATTGGESR